MANIWQGRVFIYHHIFIVRLWVVSILNFLLPRRRYKSTKKGKLIFLMEVYTKHNVHFKQWYDPFPFKIHLLISMNIRGTYCFYLEIINYYYLTIWNEYGQNVARKYWENNISYFHKLLFLVFKYRKLYNCILRCMHMNIFFSLRYTNQNLIIGYIEYYQMDMNW